EWGIHGWQPLFHGPHHHRLHTANAPSEATFCQMKHRQKKKLSRLDRKPLSLLLPPPVIVSDSSDIPSPVCFVRMQTTGTNHSETVKWGWILLFLTWMVFVIGAGGIFGAWDWAFENVDVFNSTSVDLTDNDIFVMPGYYPILIVLSGGVTAWLWVVINWMGMKFFRHN
ncbi:hypothetical protein NEOLI_004157, partial [Neolecta irregularis DAH-3]